MPDSIEGCSDESKSNQRPRRLTAEKEQETQSRAQFVEAMKGWNCNPQSEDLGEDFLVAIFDDGRSTGLTFLAQLKSTSNVQKRKPKRKPKEIHYPVEVKDLEHWEDWAPPVVVIVWDVNRREGYWQDIPAIVGALDKSRKPWRKRKYVTVSLPTKQRLSAGEPDRREQLRHRIGTLSFPSIAQGKSLSIRPTFRFPNTPEGRIELLALQTAMEDGDSVTIKGANIAKVRMSPWWERIRGTGTPLIMTITPRPPQLRFLIHVDAVGATGKEGLAFEMRCTKAGLRRVTFANDHERDAMQLTISLDKEGKDAPSVSLGFSFPHPDVDSCLTLTKMLRVIRAGGIMRLASLNGKPVGIWQLELDRLPEDEQLATWERLLTTLVFVQHRTARYGLFKVPPNVEADDILVAEKLRGICSVGEEETRISLGCALSANLEPSLIQGKLVPEDLGAEIHGEFELFGVKIPTGRVRIKFLDDEEVRRAFETAASNNSGELKFKDVRARLTYLDWMPPSDGPEPTSQANVATTIQAETP